jgi:hypothetical protein
MAQFAQLLYQRMIRIHGVPTADGMRPSGWRTERSSFRHS